jgi:hypothetical protein
LSLRPTIRPLERAIARGRGLGPGRVAPPVNHQPVEHGVVAVALW